MPSLLEVVEPTGTGGAVVGFGAPLAEGATKESLKRPMERGAYALATKDRKTVVKMLVLSKEEALFDPEAFANSSLASGASFEMLARIRATWTLGQLTFETHDPMVYSSLDFILAVASRLALQADGVVADPIARRYLLPEDVFQADRLDPKVDVREHVSVNARPRPDGLHGYTLGMQKFSLPELEIVGLDQASMDNAGRFLFAVAQNELLGDLVKSGDKFGAPALAFEAREGGFDPGLWEGIPVFELLPPTAATASDALEAWQREFVRHGLSNSGS